LLRTDISAHSAQQAFVEGMARFAQLPVGINAHLGETDIRLSSGSDHRCDDGRGRGIAGFFSRRP
jgi:hypothetical protein